jgi:asparagine synthetase B (glutamine-hydrolysing)
MIKSLLINHINNNVPDSEVAILLSGGIDSISVGISAELVGKKVNAYSFYLEGVPSYDFAMAANIASQRGWNFTPVVVPTTNLNEDWFRLVDLGCRKKTHFECVFPFLYVYPKIKEKYVLTGWGADGYFGPSKKAMMRYSSYRKKKNYVKYCKEHNQKRLNWNEFRLEYLDGDCAGYKEHTTLAEKHDKIHIAPYKDSKDIRKELMNKSWAELNTPRQKEIIRKDFTILKKYGNIKPHINLHLGSGIDKLFETLLKESIINFNNRKRIMDVCKDWHKNPNSLRRFSI